MSNGQRDRYKNLIGKAAFALLLVLPGVLVEAQPLTSLQLLEKGLKKYEMESGVISYTLSGAATGTEVLLFDRHGWRSMKRRHMEVLVHQEVRTRALLELSEGERVSRINHQDSTVKQRTDKRWSRALTNRSSEDASEHILFALGGTYRSDSVLLDKRCNVWTFDNKSLKELWVWKGLILRTKTVLAGQSILTTATHIDLNPTIEDDIFNIPQHYTITDQ